MSTELINAVGALTTEATELLDSYTEAKTTIDAKVAQAAASAEFNVLSNIARSLNVADSAVIDSTDTVTVLDSVSYIYDVSTQIVYLKNDSVGSGETISTLSGKTLTTNVTSYELSRVTTNNYFINVRDHGAKIDGVTDDYSAYYAAITLSTITGQSVYSPQGTAIVSSSLPIVEGLSFFGDGMFKSIIKKASGSATDEVFIKPTPTEIINEVSFEGITISGDRASQNTEVDGSLMAGRNIRNLHVTNCRFLEGRGFALNVNVSDKVVVTGCRFERIYRDMCAIWNTSNTIIHGNIFEHNDDDCISISTAGYDLLGGNVHSSISIVGNQMKDTGGIRTQQGKSMTIAHNVLQRVKSSEAAIFIGSNPAALYNLSNPHTIDVSNNVIVDRIDNEIRQGTAGGINNRVAIKIEGVPAIQGGLLASPRERDLSTGDVVAPYDYFYTNSGINNDQPIGRVNSVNISNNIVKRTLPSVGAYSDWGYGQMFTRHQTTGWYDPAVTDGYLQTISLTVEGAVDNVNVTDNTFDGGGAYAIYFKPLTESGTAEDFDLRRLKIVSNILSDVSSNGIFWHSAYTNTKQDIVISDNVIDCDPLLRHASRVRTTGVLTGGWSAQTVLNGIDASNIQGLKILGNSFYNCSLAYRLGGATSNTVVKDNIIYAKPATDGFSTTNLGVGTVPADSQYEATVVYTECDPTSADYGNVIDYSPLTVSGGTTPSVGFYVKGMFVTSRAISPITKNSVSQAVHGFKRLTTGTGHVNGTDWQEVWFEV